MKIKEYLLEMFNTMIFPLKVIIPQSLIRDTPGVISTEDVRIREVSKYMRGYALNIGCQYNRLTNLYGKTGGRG